MTEIVKDVENINKDMVNSEIKPPYSPKKKKISAMKRRDNIDGIIMAMIPFVGYILFSFLPMLVSLVVSFTELHSYNFSLMKFVGLDNYINIFKEDMFWLSLKNSLLFCLSVPIKMALQLYLAHLLTKHIKGSRLFRTMFFIPSICSGTAVTLVWSWILEPNFGIVNTVLASMGFAKIGFTTTKAWFMPSVLMLNTWWLSTNVILMESAMATVDDSLKEAARIDGANERQVFWKVVFPGVTPTLFYHLVTNLIAAMQEMQLMQVLATNGPGPGFAAITMVYYMYRMTGAAIMVDGFGMACAMGWIIALLIMLITRIQFWLSKKWVSYD